ncbi:MAG TPA: glutamine-hydrolyzing GMP synthase, partial [Planctomycetota bacterium]|nr:glutamine-hydrolyzing GMP synthase [Planctomycetota bacterium]
MTEPAEIATAPSQEIVVYDFGSQFAQLIARRIREHHVFCRVVTPATKAAEIASPRLRGVILSGGPASVYDAGAPTIDPAVFDLGVPVLGICYGMQLMAHLVGGRVVGGSHREFGHRELEIDDADGLFADLPKKQVVWMSHGDQVSDPGGLFETLARTASCPNAAVRHRTKPLFGIQFHPEVTHTEFGPKILGNFLKRICGCEELWRMSSFAEREIAEIRKQVGGDHVICGLSGGVDSSVAAVLVSRAIGAQLTCIFVDNGLLRRGEADDVEKVFRGRFGLDLRRVDASELFLRELEGVVEPERKRKIIGKAFIDVFEAEAKKIPGVKWLVQGTLYPDVIESVSFHGGPSATIKSHHNVGGLPEKLGFKLLEPLRPLFKDEVRALGTTLGLPDEIVWRQPFPGPGLAVRLLGAIDRPHLELLRACDAVVQEEIAKAGLTRALWQAFAVLLPIRSVGVMGDGRTYDLTCAVRAVTSVDAMTAEWARLPHDVLAAISRRIVNEVRGVNRVVYDISS